MPHLSPPTLGVAPATPATTYQGRRRISPRRVQVPFRAWQVVAGFSRLYPFLATRHRAITSVYLTTRDLFLAQRFARHARPLTTTVYIYPSGEMHERLRGMQR